MQKKHVKKIIEKMKDDIYMHLCETEEEDMQSIIEDGEEFLKEYFHLDDKNLKI